MGKKSDMKDCQQRAQVDNLHTVSIVNTACKLLFEHGLLIKSKYVDGILEDQSLMPLMVHPFLYLLTLLTSITDCVHEQARIIHQLQCLSPVWDRSFVLQFCPVALFKLYI